MAGVQRATPRRRGARNLCWRRRQHSQVLLDSREGWPSKGCLLERLIQKFSVKTMTGVVQKNIDGDIASIKTRFQFCCCAGHTKINPFDHDVHTMSLAKLLSKP